MLSKLKSSVQVISSLKVVLKQEENKLAGNDDRAPLIWRGGVGYKLVACVGNRGVLPTSPTCVPTHLMLASSEDPAFKTSTLSRIRLAG